MGANAATKRLVRRRGASDNREQDPKTGTAHARQRLVGMPKASGGWGQRQ